MMAPTAVTYTAMTPESLPAFVEHTVRGYAEECVTAGRLHEVTDAILNTMREQYFPGGSPLPGHALFDIRHDGDCIGWLWLSSKDGTAFIYDVGLDPAWQGHGLGRAALLEAERWAREQGCTILSLHVFAHNTRALRLYESLGYRTTGMSMQLNLDDSMQLNLDDASSAL